jgi:hypothetical protein
MKYNKIFGIGLNKTGTTSLTEALNILGIKTLHYEGIRKSIEFERKNNLKILSTLKEYRGFTDSPIPYLYKKLDKEYLNSKFILTIRPLNSWLKSRIKHAKRKNHYLKNCFFIYKKRWENHNKEVLDYFKDRPNDLLVMNICKEDGWEKLCPFLGIPIPDIPFPHLNKSSEIYWILGLIGVYLKKISRIMLFNKKLKK